MQYGNLSSNNEKNQYAHFVTPPENKFLPASHSKLNPKYFEQVKELAHKSGAEQSNLIHPVLESNFGDQDGHTKASVECSIAHSYSCDQEDEAQNLATDQVAHNS